MHERGKTVPLSGKNYHIRRLAPEVGSFIFMRMLGISMRQSTDAPPKRQAEETEREDDVQQEKLSGEVRVRALAFTVFASDSMKFEDFKFIQKSCMQCVSAVEERSGTEFPMPIISDSGVWTKEGSHVSDNPGLVMRLVQEVLVLCFSDFFDEGVTGL